MTREEQIKQASQEFARSIASIRPELNADSFRRGAEWADSCPPKDTSLIKWQTGKPKENGRYLIQTNNDGIQIAIWSSFVKTWSLYNESEITAWCKLSDVEAYKESCKEFL